MQLVSRGGDSRGEDVESDLRARSSPLPSPPVSPPHSPKGPRNGRNRRTGADGSHGARICNRWVVLAVSVVCVLLFVAGVYRPGRHDGFGVTGAAAPVSSDEDSVRPLTRIGFKRPGSIAPLHSDDYKFAYKGPQMNYDFPSGVPAQKGLVLPLNVRLLRTVRLSHFVDGFQYYMRLPAGRPSLYDAFSPAVHELGRIERQLASKDRESAIYMGEPGEFIFSVPQQKQDQERTRLTIRAYDSPLRQRVDEEQTEQMGKLGYRAKVLLSTEAMLSPEGKKVYSMLNRVDENNIPDGLGGGFVLTYPKLHRFLSRIATEHPYIYHGHHDEPEKEFESWISSLKGRLDRAYNAVKRMVLEGKIFIAANLYNNEKVLEYWTQSLLLLIDAIGRTNVYVSILENGSTDNTRDGLILLRRELDARGVQNSIILSNETRPAQLKQGAFMDPKKFHDSFDDTEHDRIVFMAMIRNLALEPMFERAEKGERFSKVLYINDVVWNVDDALTLLGTEEGEYDIACGLDFNEMLFYDYWVARDETGRTFSEVFPFVVDDKYLGALRMGKNARVYSCWNGMAALSTVPFVKEGIRFRHHRTNECYGSECFFICHDFQRAGYNRAFLNPNVNLAYDAQTYALHKYILSRPFVRRFIDMWFESKSSPITVDSIREQYFKKDAYDGKVDCVRFP